MTALLSEDALGLVEAEVRELIRRRGLDPVLELERTRELVDAAVRDYDQRSARGVLPALADLDAARRVLLDLVAGFGPLQPLLDDPRIEEIWINGPLDMLRLVRTGQLCCSPHGVRRIGHDLIHEPLGSLARPVLCGPP
ncbi:hypothetical protein RF640_09700 [Kocuria sp. CPCC 205231]|uniref:hypothetical protein n=1 Tax=Kocuria sp. CPCC 205231 TaxID=3073551 RepID=UPI0034D4B7DD